MDATLKSGWGRERRGPGAKSRRNLEIAIPAKGIDRFSAQQQKCLGAYSGAGRRGPGAKYRGNIDTEIPASGINDFLKSKHLGADPGPTGVSQEQHFAGI